MAAISPLQTLLYMPLVVALAFGALALCLDLALLLGRGHLHSWQALTLRDSGTCANPWLSIRVQTWRRWAAYYGDPNLDGPALSLGRTMRSSAARRGHTPSD